MAAAGFLGQRIRRTALAVVLAAIGAACVFAWLSLPPASGEVFLPGLAAPVTIQLDDWGVPTIEARGREDAYFALGYMSARDRLFQMDLLRRKAGGRLAEVFGAGAVPSDRQQRILGLGLAAQRIAAQLPRDQARVLDAYGAGVNAYIETMRIPPVEMLLAGYRLEPWTASDSMLAALNMFQLLTYSEPQERMLSVMSERLPPELLAFLTPDSDEYSAPLLGGPDSHRPQQAIPVAALRAALRYTPTPSSTAAPIAVEPRQMAASNAWAVSGVKTRDGRAILANDMHLPLSVPDTWYAARLHYGGRRLYGLALPGIPAIVVGSNGKVAWGFTNINADVVDLVRIEPDPHRPQRYRTPQGWMDFKTRRERIAVRGQAPIEIEVRDTRWGPLAEQPLLGHAVAIRWTALDPSAVNLGMLDMDAATDVDTAMAVMNRAGGPPQNVVIADHRGRIGWSYMGKIPVREGYAGDVAQSWADGSKGWRGYIAPEALPRIVDPAAQFLASANQRTLGTGYPYVIGHDYANDYRAYRISAALREARSVDEAQMLALQLDTRGALYDFYRDLALNLTDRFPEESATQMPGASAALRLWNGRADTHSLGFGLIVEFRRRLISAVLDAYLAPCRAADPLFSYRWFKVDTPLKQLLAARIPETLPDPERHQDWNRFLFSELGQVYAALKNRFPGTPMDALRWGAVNRVTIAHPYSRLAAPLGLLLDMPSAGLAGCPQCVRVVSDLHSASERLVISPGHERDAILHLPSGQSGHPLSTHYRDQHAYWVAGTPISFSPRRAASTMLLMPARERR
ncbi:MAG: penicillin acylase family protein [Gammaproteobacteria bacterium]